MIRFHVAIADLLPPASGETDGLPRLPFFEQLLSRADICESSPDWRRWALARLGCEVAGAVPALARLLAHRAGLSVEGRSWFVLSPVHLVAGMTTVHYHLGGPVTLSNSVVQGLVDGLQSAFDDPDLAFYAVGNQILMSVEGHVQASTCDPGVLAGRPLSDGRVSGADARRLLRLGSEMELWLHGQAVSGTDGRRVHALHPWAHGDGAVLPATSSVRVLAMDPFLLAAGSLEPASTASLDVWSVADLLSRGVAFADADRVWAQSLWQRLVRGEIAVAEIHVAGRVYTLRHRQRWRLWRRSRPWWEALR